MRNIGREVGLAAVLVAVLFAPVLTAAQSGAAAEPARAAADRFGLVMRADFFAGFAGSEARLAKGMEACERVRDGRDPEEPGPRLCRLPHGAR